MLLNPGRNWVTMRCMGTLLPDLDRIHCLDGEAGILSISNERIIATC